MPGISRSWFVVINDRITRSTTPGNTFGHMIRKNRTKKKKKLELSHIFWHNSNFLQYKKKNLI